MLLKAADTDIWLHPGLKLQGCTSEKKNGICNGITYEVVAITDTTLTVKDELGEYTVPRCFARKAFRLNYARTIFQAQSSTIPTSIAIHDVNSRFFTNKHLLTAVSRGTHHSLLCIKE